MELQDVSATASGSTGGISGALPVREQMSTSNTKSAVLASRSAGMRLVVQGGCLQLAWAIVVGLAVLDLAWCARAGMTINGVGIPAAAVTSLLTLSAVYRRRSPGLAETAQAAALWIAFTASGAVLSYLCATSMRPLQDAVFAEFDRKLGFDWWAWRHFILVRPWADALLQFAYGSLAPQVLLSALYLPATGRAERTAELVLLATITVLVCCVVSAFWPATGPSTEFSYLPDLLTLRSPGPWRFDLTAMQGIITMPSYHTTLAFLLTYAFRNTGVIGWGIAALNLAMLPSIPAIGGHYFVDVLAGAAVAVLCIGAVRRAGTRWPMGTAWSPAGRSTANTKRLILP